MFGSQTSLCLTTFDILLHHFVILVSSPFALEHYISLLRVQLGTPSILHTNKAWGLAFGSSFPVPELATIPAGRKSWCWLSILKPLAMVRKGAVAPSVAMLLRSPSRVRWCPNRISTFTCRWEFSVLVEYISATIHGWEGYFEPSSGAALKVFIQWHGAPTVFPTFS